MRATASNPRPSGTRQPATGCAPNDIAIATLTLARPTAADAFSDCPETGNFVIVDPISGATVAGGIIISASDHGRINETLVATNVFHLTRSMLEHGVCADLVGREANDFEFDRRAHAVVEILQAAGISVLKYTDCSFQ